MCVERSHYSKKTKKYKTPRQLNAKRRIKMGYTRFGKTIRKLMIDNEENLGTLAEMFNVTTAFVSAVLIGKKPVPEGWYSKLCDHYNLNDAEKDDLYDAYCDTKNTIKLDVTNFQTCKKKLALQFQRKLPELSEEELKSLFDILGKENK